MLWAREIQMSLAYLTHAVCTMRHNACDSNFAIGAWKLEDVCKEVMSKILSVTDKQTYCR